MPKVSVIIPTYNNARFLAEGIDSVLNQTYKDIEVIVVDDGSTDETSDIARQYGDKVKYIRQENKGHAIARNVGLKASTGEYCAFLDADDVWYPEKTELQVRILDQEPQVGIVHCDQVNIDSKGVSLGKFVRNKRYLDGEIFKYLLLRKGHIGTSTALFRRKCFEQLGMLDETMREYGSEDREFWLRISKNYLIRYMEDALVNYRVLDNSLSRTRNIENMTQGRYIAIDKSVAGLKPEFYYNGILKRRAYGAIHRFLGDEYLYAKDFNYARKHYVKSISYTLFDFWSWINLIKSILKFKVRLN